jgi:hypothetical protein
MVVNIINNNSKKAFIINIIITALFIIFRIINFIQYRIINNTFDNISLNIKNIIIIDKILYGISLIFYIKIIVEFIISIIMFKNKKTKSYFLLIPLIILSLIYFYLFFSFTFAGYTTNDYLVVGFHLFLLTICLPIGQIVWINIIENKIYIIISIIMSVVISIILFDKLFILMFNI